MKLLFSITLITLSAIGLSAQIIADQNRINWTSAGVPGGIPTVDWIMESVVDHGADPSGVNNSSHAVLKAINALPKEGGIVFFPEGKYRLNNSISIARDNIILRGAGISRTQLFSFSTSSSIVISGHSDGSWQDILSGAILNSNSIVVNDISEFRTGQFVEIQQENDPALMYTDARWNVGWAANSTGQILEIDSIARNELFFKTKIHYTYDQDFNPEIRPLKMVKNVGIEDLYIEKKSSAEHTINFQYTAHSWVSNIKSYKTRKSHIDLFRSKGIEIRNSFMQKSFNYGGGGSGYGVNCTLHTSDCLIENNGFDSLRHAMLVQLGANGNVFGYNYSRNPLQGNSTSNLNNGWTPPDISVHGHYPYMNLFEGNDVYFIFIADFWGPAGIGNTYFRNKVTAGDGEISFQDHSHDQNIIGNIGGFIKDQDFTSKGILRHGNLLGNIIEWDPTTQDTVLANSYYLKEAPYGFSVDKWPAFGPYINEDLPTEILYDSLKGLSYSLPKPEVEQKIEEEEPLPIITSQKDNLTNWNIEVFPNPTSQILNIRVPMPGTEQTALEIYNTTGKLLEYCNYTRTDDVITYDLSDIQSSIIFIRIKTKNNVLSKRVIVSK